MNCARNAEGARDPEHEHGCAKRCADEFGTNRLSSIAPLLLSNWQAVQSLSQLPPVRQVRVHQRDELRVMCRFQQVRQFVDDDVLQAFGRLLRQVRIEPYVARMRDTAAPLGFHALHEHPIHLDPQ